MKTKKTTAEKPGTKAYLLKELSTERANVEGLKTQLAQMTTAHDSEKRLAEAHKMELKDIGRALGIAETPAGSVLSVWIGDEIAKLRRELFDLTGSKRKLEVELAVAQGQAKNLRVVAEIFASMVASGRSAIEVQKEYRTAAGRIGVEVTPNEELRAVVTVALANSAKEAFTSSPKQNGASRGDGGLDEVAALFDLLGISGGRGNGGGSSLLSELMEIDDARYAAGERDEGMPSLREMMQKGSCGNPNCKIHGRQRPDERGPNRG